MATKLVTGVAGNSNSVAKSGWYFQPSQVKITGAPEQAPLPSHQEMAQPASAFLQGEGHV
jgi:hypothetical protein